MTATFSYSLGRGEGWEIGLLGLSPATLHAWRGGTERAKLRGMPSSSEGAWTEFAAGATAALGAVGGPLFAETLFRWVTAFVQVDSCAVFAFDQSFHPRHIFTVGRLGPQIGEELARDYTETFAKLDPSLRQLSAKSGRSEDRVIAFGDLEDYPDFYLDRFFVQNALVDKAVVIHSTKREHVYCNFYRMVDTGCFSDDDWQKLRVLLPFAGALIAHHAAHVQEDAADGERRGASVTSRFVNDLASSGRPPFDVLTSREREVCARILLGLTTEGIGLELGIAPSTVVTYRRRAYEKLDICSQKDLFRLCLEESVRERE